MTIMGCSPCYDTCTIYTNDFTVNDLATNWSVSSGSFSISGGTLNVTSAGTIINTVAGTTGHGSLVCNALTTFNGVTFTFIGAYVDANNYLRLEVFASTTAGTLKLIKKVAGVDTQLGSTIGCVIATGSDFTARLCWNGTEAVGMVDGVSGYGYGPYTGTGNKIGLAGSATNCKFDDITFSKTSIDSSNCPTCKGATCSPACAGSGNPTATFFQVDIGNCGVYTGTYIIEFAGTSGRDPENSGCIHLSKATECGYAAGGFGHTNCNLPFGVFGINLGFGVALSSPMYSITLQLTSTAPGGDKTMAVFILTSTVPFNCLTFNQLSLPLVCSAVISIGVCDGTGATCKITSL